jgi:O-antigen/teichoic acid export membrane protein
MEPSTQTTKNEPSRSGSRRSATSSVAPRLRSLVGQSLTYGLGGFASRIVGFFLVPVYVSYAGREAFGVVELVVSAITAAAIVLRLGITASMSRFTLGDPDRDDWTPVIQTVFTFVMLASSGAALISVLLVDQIASLLGVSRNVTLVGVVGLWVTMNYDVVARIYRIERRARSFVFFTLLNVAVTVVLTLVLVIGYDTKATGLMIGNFGGSVLVYGLLLVARRHSIGFRRFDWGILRAVLDYSLPLMPAGLALWGLNFADRAQIQGLSTTAELGSYAVASKVALGVTLAVGAFQTAWPPFAHSIRGEGTAKQTFRQVFTYWAVLMGWAVAALTLISAPYIRLAFPGDVHDAIPVVPLLMAGTVLYGGFMVVNIGVTFSKKTRMTPVIATFAAALNIGLNFLMIPAWGIVGAGVSTVIGYAVLLWLGWLNAQRSYPVDYDWDKVLRILAVTTAYVALSLWVLPETGAPAVVLRLLAAGSFPLALLAVGAVSTGDRDRVKGLLAMRARRRADAPEDTVLDEGATP